MDNHRNFAYGTVLTLVGAALTLSSGHGSRFPSAPFNVVVYPSGALPLDSNAEIVRVTNRSGDVLTIARAQEGSTQKVIGPGWTVAGAVTSKTLSDIEDNFANYTPKLLRDEVTATVYSIVVRDGQITLREEV